MFIVALAAVVNGLGIVRIVGGLGEFIRKRESLNVTYYWIHSALVLFQLLVQYCSGGHSLVCARSTASTSCNMFFS